MSWIVRLIKPPTIQTDFPTGFFPRKYHYKREALRIAANVDACGGVAQVSKGTLQFIIAHRGAGLFAARNGKITDNALSAQVFGSKAAAYGVLRKMGCPENWRIEDVG